MISIMLFHMKFISMQDYPQNLPYLYHFFDQTNFSPKTLE